MVVIITDEERAKLREGWHIVRGSQPYVKRVLWGEITTFGEREYVFVIIDGGEERVYRSSVKGEVFDTEHEAWQHRANELEQELESDRMQILGWESLIREHEQELKKIRGFL